MTRALPIIVLAMVSINLFSAMSVSAHPAWGIVVDRNNQVYFSDIETIWKIDAQGKLTVFRAGVSGRHIHEITLDQSGNLYGVDNSYEPATQQSISALWKMTPAGEFSYLVSPTDSPPKALTNWKDRAGNTYYVGQSDDAQRELFVLKRTPDGKVTTLAGNHQAGDVYRQVVLFNLGGTAFGSDDSLYLTDNSNLHKVTQDGSMTLLAGNLTVEKPAESPLPESRLTRLFGLAVDAQGNTLVADYGNRRVIKVTPGSNVSTVAVAEQPWSPTGVALKDGNLYILEFGFTQPSTYTPRVRKLSADGKITLLAALDKNGNPSLGEPESARSPERSTRSKINVTVVFLVACVSIFVLTLIIWRVSRGRANQPR